jgi:hypothetical protein
MSEEKCRKEMKEVEKRRMSKCRIISDERDKYRKTNAERKYVEEGDMTKKDVSAIQHRIDNLGERYRSRTITAMEYLDGLFY